ncbi:MAG: NYN domain-containing protein [Woeseiaceae bacterium]|nr:NYN domain-containing protein [Woeseiaceae bacterium]
MPNNYVLIDYENVQPKNLELLASDEFKVFVFVGQNQAKIPFDLADSMQLLGKNARYVQITGNGQNALDFHIAYYIGELAAGEPDAFFHIISKDKGFDPLINHLKERKIRVHREKDIGEIPLLQLADTSSIDEKISAVVKNLGGRGQSRPRKVTTLSNTINSLFNPKLSAKELSALVKEMEKRKLIVINKNNVSYKLPH